MSVIEIDPTSEAVLELGPKLKAAMGAEAIVIVVLKHDTDGSIISKSRLVLYDHSKLQIEDIQKALSFAIEDIAHEELDLS